MLMLLAFYIFSHWIWRPVSPDERHYLALGMKIYKEGRYETLKGNPEVKVPPLHPFSLSLAMRFFGPHTDSAQAVSLIFGVFTVGVVFLLGCTIWNRWVGSLGALLLITSGKGIFWQYSNRVLNEVLLAFFIITAVFWAVLYTRTARTWVLIPMGATMGLGLLTKEFMALVAPALIVSCLIAEGSVRKKVLAVVVIGMVAFIFILPWLIHVKQEAGSPLAGLFQRAKGHAVEAVLSKSSWGLRGINDWVEMILFFDRPAWFSQLLWIMSMVFLIRYSVTKGSKAGWIFLVVIFTWWLVFGSFKALPLNLRRFVPLLPLAALIISVFLNELLRWLSHYIKDGPAARRLFHGAVVIAIGIVLINDIKPKRTLKGFNPFCILCSPKPPYLRDEMIWAIQCLPPGAGVASNYKSLLYFYSKGTLKPSGIPVTLVRGVKPWDKNKNIKESVKTGGDFIYDYVYRKRRIVMDENTLLRGILKNGKEYLVFFDSGNKRLAPPQLGKYLESHPEMFLPVCIGDRFQVYRVSLQSLSLHLKE
jgi:hypothetical protein